MFSQQSLRRLLFFVLSWCWHASFANEVFRVGTACSVHTANDDGSCHVDENQRIPRRAISALQVQAQSRSPQVPSAASLPPNIYQLGLKAYGTQEALEAAVRSSQAFTASVGGFQIQAHCAPRDDIHDKSDDLEESFQSYGASRLATQPAGVHVFDIGANLGILTVALYKTNPKLTLIAIEAMPETYFYMNWNLYENGVPILGDLHSGAPGVLPLNEALGSGETVTMAYSSSPAGGVTPGHEESSIHAFASSGAAGADRIMQGARQYTMKTVSLSSLFTKHGLSKGSPVFLFFDCQGCEFGGILPSLRELSGAANMGGELHCYDPQVKSACWQLQGEICNRGQGSYFRWFSHEPDDHEELHRGIACQ